MQVRKNGEIPSHNGLNLFFFSNFYILPVVIFPEAQYFQIMPNFEDFQQLKSWKRQGAGAPTKFYKSNKENISCSIAVYSRKLWKSKTNFEHWKFMKSHQIANTREKLSWNLPPAQYYKREHCLNIFHYVLLIGDLRSDFDFEYAAILDSSIEIKAWPSHSALFTIREHKR